VESQVERQAKLDSNLIGRLYFCDLLSRGIHRERFAFFSQKYATFECSKSALFFLLKNLGQVYKTPLKVMDICILGQILLELNFYFNQNEEQRAEVLIYS